jgi:hypothetical protein
MQKYGEAPIWITFKHIAVLVWHGICGQEVTEKPQNCHLEVSYRLAQTKKGFRGNPLNP